MKLRRIAPSLFAAFVLVSLPIGAPRAQEADTTPATGPLPRTLGEVERLLRETGQDARLVRRAEAQTTAPPPEGDPAALARYLLERGTGARRLGRYEQARRDLEQALTLVPKGSSEEIYGLMTLRDVQGSMGDMGSSETTHARLLANAPADSGALVYVHASRINQQLNSGDLRGARLTAVQLEQTYRNLSATSRSSRYFPVWTANYEAGRGSLALGEGRYAEAADAFRRALREQTTNRKAFVMITPATALERGWEHGQDVLEGRLVASLRAQQRLVEAESLGREALVTAVRINGGQSVRAGDALMNLSVTLWMQGRYADARALAQQALIRFQGAGAERVSARVLVPMLRNGQYLAYEERWTDVNKAFSERAQLIAENPELRKRAGPDNFYWALALARLGEHKRAVPMARRVVQLLTRRSEPADRIAMAQGIYAIALARSGDRNGALKEFREALPTLLDRESVTETEEGMAAYRVQRLKWVLEEYLRLLASGGDAASADEAFRIADIARGSGVQRALAASAGRESFADPELSRLAREEQDLANRVRAISEILAGVLERSTDAKVLADLRGEIDAARSARRKVRAQIAQRFPDYAQLLDPKPLSLDETRQLLAEGELLVSVYAAEDETYVWAARKDREPVFARVPLTSAQLTQKVKRLRRALDPGEVDPGTFPIFDVALAHELYQTLLGPAESVLDGATHLLVVPHGALGQLNPSLLVTSPAPPGKTAPSLEGYRGVSWLVRKTAVSQLPSVAALAALRRVPPPPANRAAFAGFGDPAYGGAPETSASTRGVRLRNARRSSGDGSEVKSDWTNQLMRLAQLPDTSEEIREIARMLRSDVQRDVRLGPAATETAVKTADLSTHRVIAFATHGLLPGDLEGLTEPALAFSNPKITGERNADGLLTLGEILALKLNADWVVLSACNTGAAEGEGAEAVSGLGRGFFFAGARALLVSNWPVETVSARLLTTGIFRHQAEAPKLPRAEALRRSMLDVLDRGAAVGADGKPAYVYAHPIFWAAFSLVGDGR